MKPRISLLALLAPLVVMAACAGQDPATQPAAAPPATQEAPRRVHVFVSGRVQGVGFRYFTQDHARQLKLRGWVKNLSDGRVEIVIEGRSGAVSQLLDLVHQGPSDSRVDDVKVTEEKPTGQFKGFEIDVQ